MARWTCSHSPPFLRLVFLSGVLDTDSAFSSLEGKTCQKYSWRRRCPPNSSSRYVNMFLWWNIENLMEIKFDLQKPWKMDPAALASLPTEKAVKMELKRGQVAKKRDRIPWNDIFIGWVPQCLHPTSQQSQQIKRSTTMCIHCKVNSLPSLDFINQFDLQVHPRLRCNSPKQLEEDVPRKLPPSSSELKKSQY